MKVLLSKIEGGDAIRTSVAQGECFSRPTAGLPFMMVAEPLAEGAAGRLIITSKVTEVIENENTVIIKTLNSTYKLEFDGKS